MIWPQRLAVGKGSILLCRSGARSSSFAVLASFCLLSQNSPVARAFSVKPQGTMQPPKSASHTSSSSSSSMSQPLSTTTTPTQKQPANAWCCTAVLDSTTKQPRLTTIAGDNDANKAKKNGLSFQRYQENSYDVTASPDWMEWIEVTEDRGKDEGGAGAYDTMRCDLIVKSPQENQRDWRIWGEDYHLKRLQNSCSSLLDASHANTITDAAMERATKESDLLLRALMEEAKSNRFLKDNSLIGPGEKEDEEHTWIQLVKLTLLWSLPKDNKNNNDSSESSASIVVRGHACSTGKPVPVFRSVQPIIVTVAALAHKGDHQPHPHHNNDDAKIDTSLPTRFQNPQSKVASWCKQRKKMDNPETYKPSGVSEVLMVRPTTIIDTSANQPENNINEGAALPPLELLEGLSSNVFVIYKDGTLRTPQEGVLFGYVRHLVLESAAKCGLKVDTTTPITMQDAVDGKWSEVFITSSSRLIWPISRILLPSSEDKGCLNEENASEECDINGFSEFWSDPILTGPGVPVSTPIWQELLEDILHSSAGYKR